MPDIAEINPELTIFIRLNYRHLIFRLFSGEYRVMGDKIVCKIPQEARAALVNKEILKKLDPYLRKYSPLAIFIFGPPILKEEL